MEDVRLEFSEEIIVKSTNSDSEFVDSDGLKKGQLIVDNQGTTFKDIKLSDSRIHINGCSRDFESFDDLSKYVVHLEKLSGITNNIYECPFKIGDIISYDGVLLFLFEGIDNNGNVLRSYCCNYYGKECLEKVKGDIGFKYNEYEKATCEQELFFKQKCLEKGIWFDKESKKWIELKEGEVYELVSIHKDSWFFIFKGFRSKSKGIIDYASLLAGNVIINEYCEVLYDKVYNISEASKEEKQYFFDKLEEVGKQWNADKKCIDDFKWKPKDFDRYWYMDSRLSVYECNNIFSYSDLQRIDIGNCFKTKEECIKYIEYMRECSLNYKP